VRNYRSEKEPISTDIFIWQKLYQNKEGKEQIVVKSNTLTRMDIFGNTWGYAYMCLCVFAPLRSVWKSHRLVQQYWLWDILGKE